MASIPLLCNICPKQPDFSDISHLLTHVASKGHLSHYFKAQVGGRQDENVRRRVETYTRWYDENGIEQLLSQRMASKDTRKATRSSKVTTQKAKGRSKPHRKKSKAEPPSEMRSPTKVEYTIDPQLANPMPSQDDMHNGLYCSPGQRSVLNSRRSFVPHMSDWQLEPDGQHLAGGRIALELGESMITSPREREEDLECFRDFLRSPTSTTYPDPTEQPNGSTFLISDMHGDVFSGVTSGESYEKSRDEHEGLIANPSPVLKGVKWPGMSIFDSASTDAQRLRNQKKADSVLGQMEHNSTAVEPVEVIYWPEGHLKKKRIITGNVESSPISEPTPRARRKRSMPMKSRTALASLDPNKLVRQRKPGKGVDNVATSHGRKNPYVSDEEDSDEVEQYLAREKSSTKQNTGVMKNFANFGGPRTRLGGIRKGSAPSSEDVHQESFQIIASEIHGFPFHDSRRPDGQHRRSQQRSIHMPDHDTLTTPSNRRSADIDDPFLDHSHDMMGSPVERSERSIQRYFVLNGNEEPQFFSTMPPQMDFGGMLGSSNFGSRLNPLHPAFRRRRS